MILHGDCLEILPTLEANSVQCVVTSPPYYRLRDYGTATWEGGLEDCDHSPRKQLRGTFDGGMPASLRDKPFYDCPKCGAIRIDYQIGLESSPEAYVEKLVAVFREVRRVLRDDGTVWLNLGDSYAGYHGNKNAAYDAAPSNKDGYFENQRKSLANHNGLKPKDLIGIPWRVAFALQSDGWRLRQDIIWSKSNPMPESVTDRCTKSHEYIFLLTKSARYFYDAEAVKEPQQQCTTERYRYGWNGVDDDGSNGARTGSAYKKMKAGMNMGDAMGGNGMRNKRSVWTISTKPYRAAHFATFPQEIPEICIKAGSRVGDTILDPFSGAGTTGLVADKLGRKYIGIELNPTYAAMGEDRIFNDCPLFAEASC